MGGRSEVGRDHILRKPSKQPRHRAPSPGQTWPHLCARTRTQWVCPCVPTCAQVSAQLPASLAPVLASTHPPPPPLPAAAPPPPVSPGQPLGGGLEDPLTPVAVLAPPSPPFRLQPLRSLERGPVARRPVPGFPLGLGFSVAKPPSGPSAEAPCPLYLPSPTLRGLFPSERGRLGEGEVSAPTVEHAFLLQAGVQSEPIGVSRQGGWEGARSVPVPGQTTALSAGPGGGGGGGGRGRSVLFCPLVLGPRRRPTCAWAAEWGRVVLCPEPGCQAARTAGFLYRRAPSWPALMCLRG